VGEQRNEVEAVKRGCRGKDMTVVYKICICVRKQNKMESVEIVLGSGEGDEGE
jgi:transketolase N-terminal domain/subunit